MTAIAWLEAGDNLAHAGFYILLSGRPVIGPFAREADVRACVPPQFARYLNLVRHRADAVEGSPSAPTAAPTLAKAS